VNAANDVFTADVIMMVDVLSCLFMGGSSLEGGD